MLRSARLIPEHSAQWPGSSTVETREQPMIEPQPFACIATLRWPARPDRDRGITAYIVTRWSGPYSQDYLLEWDVIWGPVWTGSKAMAVKFAEYGKARDAATTAVACMAPVPWRVPALSAEPSPVYVTPI